MFANKDFMKAFYDAQRCSEQPYNETNASLISNRLSDRRMAPDRRLTVPWVVDPNDRRSGYDRRTGLDRRGNKAPR
jgi:hypothetical protein